MGALPPPPPLLLLLLLLCAAIAQSKITSDRGRWWPNGRVFYRIHFGVDSALVHGAMAAIEARTCVRFIENDFLSTQHHIDVVAGDDCFSDIGYKHSTNAAAAFPDLQLLSLGPRCASKGIALHEIGHALGLSHEHNRLDRDLYVRVLPRNVRQGRTGEFYRKSELEHFGVPYDVGSIMHYSARTFAREGVNAMLPLDENFHQTMGQRGDMTFYDAKLLNMAYCRESCGASDLPCQNSGYPNPNDCAQCLCPSEFTGRFARRSAATTRVRPLNSSPAPSGSF